MNFSVNHPVLYILAGLCIIAVISQSAVFLKKAWKRALELGYSKEKLNKVVKSSIVFTIAPAIAIGIGVITLAPTLGIPLPWLRLSVVGSIVYELSAADTAASAMKITLGQSLDAKQFVTIAFTMTTGIITGLVLIPGFCRKTVTGMSSVGMKDKKWGEHFSNALFYGLIATFVGQGLSGVSVDAKGRVQALVLLISAIVMAICGILRGKFKWKWINDYALPICMVVAMIAAIPLSIWLA